MYRKSLKSFYVFIIQQYMSTLMSYLLHNMMYIVLRNVTSISNLGIEVVWEHHLSMFKGWRMKRRVDTTEQSRVEQSGLHGVQNEAQDECKRVGQNRAQVIYMTQLIPTFKIRHEGRGYRRGEVGWMQGEMQGQYQMVQSLSQESIFYPLAFVTCFFFFLFSSSNNCWHVTHFLGIARWTYMCTSFIDSHHHHQLNKYQHIHFLVHGHSSWSSTCGLHLVRGPKALETKIL